MIRDVYKIRKRDGDAVYEAVLRPKGGAYEWAPGNGLAGSRLLAMAATTASAGYVRDAADGFGYYALTALVAGMTGARPIYPQAAPPATPDGPQEVY